MPAELAADNAHLLVVDDDARLRALLQRYLAEQGFRVTAAADAAAARGALAAMAFDLVVLDVMMPGESGIALARSLRDDAKRVPILMLTAMGEPQDRIAGLEKGVDDYLPKPFEARELLLRIQSVLRRGRPVETSEAPERVTFGPMQFDLALGELTQKGRRVSLTDAEIALLRALGAHLGEVLSREALCKMVGSGLNERAIDVQVTRLRRKIEPDPGFPRYLRTVRGQGYRLVDA